MIDAAILLAAGLGTRLAPLSWVRAKAALPVAGEAIIRRQIRWLAGAGVRRVVVNLHHLPASIAALVGHGDDLGVEVRYSWEPVVLGSGGGPRRAFDLLGAERAFIVNGDTLTSLDLEAMAAVHLAHRPLVTMASTPEARAGYNALAVTTDGAFAGVTRAGAPPVPALASCHHVHFIGVQVAERAAFADVAPDRPSEVLKTIYPALVARAAGAVRIWPTDVAFHDIGTPADYLATVQTLAHADGRPLDRGATSMVHPGADVTGSVVWDGVRVDGGAVVRECVLADGVAITAGRMLTRMAVVPRQFVPPGAAGHGDGELWCVPLDRSS